jgi:hypothetical protein
VRRPDPNKEPADVAAEVTSPAARSRQVAAAESRPGGPTLVVRLASAPAALPPVTRVRSTLITSSLRALEERKLTELYFKLLAKEHASEIRDAIAGVWLPVEVAIAHYRACDALGMTNSEQLEMGRRVGDKIQGTLLGTLVTVAKQAGVSPWTFLERLDRFYERLAVGGGVAVTRLADKDALVDLYKVPLFDIPYFSTAWRGVIQGICDLFCTKAFVKPGRQTAEKMTYSISWA